VFYDDSWGGIFQGASGVIFVADSQLQRNEANAEFFRHFDTNLAKAGLPLDLPYVLQANKRDLPHLVPLEALSHDYGRGSAAVGSSAWRGDGVLDAFRLIVERVMQRANVDGVIDWSNVWVEPRAPRPTVAMAAQIAVAPRHDRRSLLSRLIELWRD
jgi:hypothetical protein